MFRSFLLVLCALNACASDKYNVRLKNMSSCKEHVINNVGYAYSSFIEIASLANNPTVGKELLHLKFIVMTNMSAHILLSDKSNPSRTDYVYEFILGGWNNEFSAYRLQLSGKWLWQKPSKSIVGEFDPLPMEIIHTNDGLISISIPGKKKFLYYFDKIPLDIKYVSFSTHDTSKYARWFYDCNFDDSIMTSSPIDPTLLTGSNIIDLAKATPSQNNNSSEAKTFNYYITVN